MEFTVHTAYNAKALTALAAALRKTMRKKRSRRSRVIAVLFMILGVILILGREQFDLRSAVTAAVVLIMALALCFEDRINGWVAGKRGIPGLKSAVTVFRETGYTGTTEIGESTLNYENVSAAAESQDYFFLLLGPNHGEVFAKAELSGGTVEEFRAFLQEKTQKTIQKI